MSTYQMSVANYNSLIIKFRLGEEPTNVLLGGNFVEKKTSFEIITNLTSFRYYNSASLVLVVYYSHTKYVRCLAVCN